MISFHCIFVHQTFIARFGKTINHVLQWQRLKRSLLVQSISLWNTITFDPMLWTKRFVSTTYILRVKKRISSPNQWRTNSFQSYVIFYAVGNVSLRGSCTFVHLRRYCCGTRECENMRYSSHGLRSWSVLDVAIYCLIIWYDKYLGMISISVGVIMARTPSWWSHQESILTVHIYLHNISRNKLIKSINKQTQTSIKHIYYSIYFYKVQTTFYFNIQPNGIRLKSI